MNSEEKTSALIAAVRRAVRYHVPITEMKLLARFTYPDVGGSTLSLINLAYSTGADDEQLVTQRVFDFTVLYHMVVLIYFIIYSRV